MRVNDAENQIGKGQKTIESFSLGQLVALFRNSSFLSSWSRATGNELRGITMINLDELVRLRNEITHIEISGEGAKGRSATRAESELLLSCLQSILETFGILSLDALSTPLITPGRPADTTPPIPRGKKRARSAYSPDSFRESARLKVQSAQASVFDQNLLTEALQGLPDSDLVVVDLGCANGNVTRSRFEDERFSHILGIDVCGKSVRKARESGSDGDKFTFLELDLEGEGLEQAIDDYLSRIGKPRAHLFFSALTIHHMANPVKLLRRCRWLAQDTAVIVLRGSDDGSKLAYPDDDDNMGRVIELTLKSPLASDRNNGRKLYNQLYRAGFRKISIKHDTVSTAGMSVLERSDLFSESFSWRPNYLVTALKSDPDNREYTDLLTELNERLADLELDFEADDFYYSENTFGAIARP